MLRTPLLAVATLATALVPLVAETVGPFEWAYEPHDARVAASGDTARAEIRDLGDDTWQLDTLGWQGFDAAGKKHYGVSDFIGPAGKRWRTRLHSFSIENGGGSGDEWSWGAKRATDARLLVILPAKAGVPLKETDYLAEVLRGGLSA